jgi:hypothetical protein
MSKQVITYINGFYSGHLGMFLRDPLLEKFLKGSKEVPKIDIKGGGIITVSFRWERKEEDRQLVCIFSSCNGDKSITREMGIQVLKDHFAEPPCPLSSLDNFFSILRNPLFLSQSDLIMEMITILIFHFLIRNALVDTTFHTKGR